MSQTCGTDNKPEVPPRGNISFFSKKITGVSVYVCVYVSVINNAANISSRLYVQMWQRTAGDWRQ